MAFDTLEANEWDGYEKKKSWVVVLVLLFRYLESHFVSIQQDLRTLRCPVEICIKLLSNMFLRAFLSPNEAKVETQEFNTCLETVYAICLALVSPFV